MKSLLKTRNQFLWQKIIGLNPKAFSSLTLYTLVLLLSRVSRSSLCAHCSDNYDHVAINFIKPSLRSLTLTVVLGPSTRLNNWQKPALSLSVKAGLNKPWHGCFPLGLPNRETVRNSGYGDNLVHCRWALLNKSLVLWQCWEETRFEFLPRSNALFWMF